MVSYRFKIVITMFTCFIGPLRSLRGMVRQSAQPAARSPCHVMPLQVHGTEAC